MAAPPFTDARSCKEWLGVLPLTNIPQAQSQVLEALRAMNESSIQGIDRLKCLELMREKIAFLQGEQRSRYFGKTLPLSPNDSAAWTTGRTLLQEMEAGYRGCLEAARQAEGGLAEHRALLAQRMVRTIGGQMVFHELVYRRFDPALWSRLHDAYRRAEAEGLATEAVKDSLEGEGGMSNVAEAYVHAVLFEAACPFELAAPQMDLVEALLKLWARRVPVSMGPPEGAKAVCLMVDLDRDLGARPLAGETGGSQRVLNVDQVSASLRKRIHGLEQNEDPATLGLPATTGTFDLLSHLKRLHRLWCEGAPPRPPSKASKEASVGLAFGMNDAHFMLTGGKAFEQPDKSRELTRQEKNDIAMFGRVTERTQSMMASDHQVQLENWAVVEEMLGSWRLQRPSSASKGIAIGRIAALRAGASAPFYLALVTALTQETDGRIIATLTLFPGRPEIVPVRAGDARNRANPQWFPGFRLPALERLKIPPSIVVPPNIAARGRGVELWEGQARETTVDEILERGSDFDRITTY